MKNYKALLLSLFCIATVELPAFKVVSSRQPGVRKNKQRRKSLAHYFNLDTQADIIDDVTDTSDENIVDDNGDMISDSESQVVEDVLDSSSDDEGDDLSDTSATDDDSDDSFESDESDDQLLPEEAEDIDTQEAMEDDDSSLTDEQEMQDDQQEDQEEDQEESYLPSEEPKVYRKKMTSPVDVGQDYLEDVGFDLQKKQHDTIDLVIRAKAFFRKNSLEESMRVFTHTKDFINGDLYIFVYDQDGICLANPSKPEALWENMYEKRNAYGLYPVREIIKEADKGGGWLDFVSDGATMLTYVQKVTKDSRAYYLACGFYTHSKHDAVVGLVQSAVAYFDKLKEEKAPVKRAFEAFNYRKGNFVKGDLYLYMMRFDGLLVVHGDNSDFLDTNGLNYKDESGRLINQEIIKKVRRSSEGVWVDYNSKNTIKKLYAEMVTDNKGHNYFIGCGYYPDADREEAVDLVRKMYSYMKSNGITISLQIINSRATKFKYGSLYIEIYDENGVCVANGDNPSLVKADITEKQNEDGLSYTQEIIKKGKSGGGWINYKDKKLFRSVYIEPISMATKKYYIACGLYPVSKKDTMALLVKGASGHLEESEWHRALRDFIKPKTPFRRGDLEIFVLDVNGTCLAYGKEYDLIWRNLLNVADDNGVKLFKKMIDTARSGAGLIKYSLNGAEKLSYIEPVQKNGKKYVVGSGYYL